MITIIIILGAILILYFIYITKEVKYETKISREEVDVSANNSSIQNTNSIKSAGRKIKRVAILMVFSLLLTVILVFVLQANKTSDLVSLMYFFGIVQLLIIIFIIINLYNAGDILEQS